MIMEKGFWDLPGKLALFLAVFVASQACTGSDDLHNEENNYWHYCSSCHGRDGTGKGMMATTLPVRPRNHTDARIMGKRTDEQLFKTISEGGEATGLDSAMPPHKTILQKEEIHGLVKYIRKLCNCKYTG